MKVVVQIEETGDRKLLRLNEQLSFGSSSQSQYQIDDSSMAGKHFTVSAQSEGCWIECHGSNTVQVNGIPAAHQILRNGDQLRAGSTSFRVEVEGFSESQIQTVAQTDSLIALSYSVSRPSEEVDLYKSMVAAKEFEALFADWAKEREIYLLADFRSADIQIPDQYSGSVDLYAGSQPDDSEPSELRFIPLRTAEEAAKAYGELHNKDAAILLFTSDSPEQLLGHLKFYFAWFSQPSLFLFHIVNSGELAKKLLAQIDMAFGADPESPGWWLAANPQRASDWSKVGFETSPSNVEP